MQRVPPIVITAQWPYKKGRYAVTITLTEIYGRFEPIRVDVEALDPLRGRVTSEVLSRVPVARLVSQELESRMQAATDLMRPIDEAPLQNWTQDEHGRWVVDQTVYDDTDRKAFWAAKQEDAGRLLDVLRVTGDGPSRRYPEGHLEEVAEIYMGARRMHQHPTKAVRDRFGMTPAVAARHVQRARAKGLLPPTTGKGSTRPRKEGSQ